MKPIRTLRLKSETLSELTTGELRAVAGGDNTRYCLSETCHTWGARCFVSEVLNACELTATCA